MLQVGSLTPLGLSLPALLRSQTAVAKTKFGPHQDVNCILIWTRGGTSHHETLDPKPQAKASIRGDFGTVNTALPGIRFSDQMPKFARHLKSFTVMRNFNPRNGSHATADAIMMSGKRFNPSITFPCYGSVVAKEKGFRTNLPPFAQIGTNVDHRFGGGYAGFLGLAYNAFVLPGDPNAKNFTVRDITPPKGISLKRLDRRRQALQAIGSLQRGLDSRPDALQAIDKYYRNAFSMITSPATQKAFDLNTEKTSVRDEYGRTSLGQSCLLARRLIEAGTRFVTVTSGGWDTHTQNFKRLKSLLPPLDSAFPALIADLKQRGLLETTLVVWLTDFGRTPIINSAAGRDHWSSAATLCMAGAGTPGGQVVGRTDEIGSHPVGQEYYTPALAATIYSKLGISLDTIHTAPDGRPIRLCEGKPIKELMG